MDLLLTRKRGNREKKSRWRGSITGAGGRSGLGSKSTQYKRDGQLRVPNSNQCSRKRIPNGLGLVGKSFSQILFPRLDSFWKRKAAKGKRNAGRAKQFAKEKEKDYLLSGGGIKAPKRTSSMQKSRAKDGCQESAEGGTFRGGTGGRSL